MSITDFETVTPTKPLAPYLGGKSQLAKTIIPIINSIPHTTYIEPFLGMGGIFLRRNRKPKAEIINDFNKELINLFRILQRHYAIFMDMMKYQVTSRAAFERLSRTDPSTLTDLENAARFLYLQRTAFGGRVSGQNFGVTPTSSARFNIIELADLLDSVHSRLAGVTIEALPYQELIARYDKAGTLFYLDPPYWGCETHYGKDMFSRADFTCLRELLNNLQGIFILSLNDLPEVRAHFADFNIRAVTTTYSVAQKYHGQPEEVSELLISNVDLDMTLPQQAFDFDDFE